MRYLLPALACLIVACKSKEPLPKLIQSPSQMNVAKVLTLSGLTSDQVTDSLDACNPELTYCYIEAFRGRRKPTPAIRLQMRLTIDPTGKAVNPRFEGRSYRNRKFEKCFQEKLLACRFPSVDVPAVTEVPTLYLDFYPAQ